MSAQNNPLLSARMSPAANRLCVKSGTFRQCEEVFLPVSRALASDPFGARVGHFALDVGRGEDGVFRHHGNGLTAASRNHVGRGMAEDRVGEKEIEFAPERGQREIRIRAEGRLLRAEVKIAKLPTDSVVNIFGVRLDAEVVASVEVWNEELATTQASASDVEKRVLFAQSKGASKKAELKRALLIKHAQSADALAVVINSSSDFGHDQSLL